MSGQTSERSLDLVDQAKGPALREMMIVSEEITDSARKMCAQVDSNFNQTVELALERVHALRETANQLEAWANELKGAEMAVSLENWIRFETNLRRKVRTFAGINPHPHRHED